MTLRYAGFFPPCIPDSHPYRITSTKCCINTVVSPDDGHMFIYQGVILKELFRTREYNPKTLI
jgi:hypothetical protein